MQTLVTGAIGSGKTYLSARIATLAAREVVPLDAIYFDLKAPRHRTVRGSRERLALLEEQLTRPQVFEGWHFGDWLTPLYGRLSCVVIVDTPLEIREERIRARFARRKAGVEPDPFPLGDEQHLQNLIEWTRLFSPVATECEIRKHCLPDCRFYFDDGFGSTLSCFNIEGIYLAT